MTGPSRPAAPWRKLVRRRAQPPLRRALRWLEGGAVGLAFGLVRLLPLDLASALGGRCARALGPRLPVSRTGRRNLRLAYPAKGEAEIEAILKGVWDNLGRTAAEYPHLARIWDYRPEAPGAGRIEVAGAEQFVRLRDDGLPALIFSAHLANWELLPIAAARLALPLAILYRPPNNPIAADLVERVRAAAMGSLLPSGPVGTLLALHALEAGQHVGLLVDQHFSRGVEVPFFGRPVRVAATLGKLARRIGCPVHGARVERLGGARFRLSLSPPLELRRTSDAAADIRDLMAQATAMIEGWVRERPEQWLWLHRRWRP